MATDESSIRVDKDDIDQKIWTCSKYSSLQKGVNVPCSTVLESSIKFRVHLRKHHHNHNFPSKFMCSISDCKEFEKQFVRFQHLRNHYDCMHRQKHDFECPVCTKTFSSSKTWTRHVKNCSSGTLKCDNCDRTFTGYSSLSRHCREKHLLIQRNITDVSCPDSSENKSGEGEISGEGPHVKYLLVPVQNVVLHFPEDPEPPDTVRPQMIAMKPPEMQSSLLQIHHNQRPYSDHLQPKRQKQTSTMTNHLQHAASQANIWNHAPTQTPPIWGNDSSGKDPTPDWSNQEVPNTYTELRRPPVGGYDEDLHDKHLFSAIDNITTQTDEFWGLNEFSTQTVTEHNSFGTQTRCPTDDVLDPFITDCDLVEYLDGEVQTDTHQKVGSASFASQTSISTQSFNTNDRSCGVERSDRDCQTNYYKNSIHTQTKMRRERSLIVVDGLNSETQTTSPQQIASLYNESFTQTIEY